MCLTEYDDEREKEILKEQYLEAGRKEGRSEGETIGAEKMARLGDQLLKAGIVSGLSGHNEYFVFRGNKRLIDCPIISLGHFQRRKPLAVAQMIHRNNVRPV